MTHRNHWKAENTKLQKDAWLRAVNNLLKNRNKVVRSLAVRHMVKKVLVLMEADRATHFRFNKYIWHLYVEPQFQRDHVARLLTDRGTYGSHR